MRIVMAASDVITKKMQPEDTAEDARLRAVH